MNSRHVDTSSRAAEIELLESFVERSWSNREIHERLDGVDIRRLFDEFRASSGMQQLVLAQYAAALRDLLWRLMDGHLRLSRTPQRLERHYQSGVALKLVREGIALAHAHPRLGPSGASRGDLIVAADGMPIEDYLRAVRLRAGSTPRQRRHHALQALEWQELIGEERPAPREIVLQNAGGVACRLELGWEPVQPDLPTPWAVRARMADAATGVLEVRTFVCRDATGMVSDLEMKQQLDRALATLAGARHLIIDLRANGGGRDEQARMLARRLAGPETEWMRHAHRGDDSVEYHAAAEPLAGDGGDDGAWEGIWILIGAGSASTTEILAAALRQAEVARLVGSTSAGSAGDPLEFRLPHSLLGVMVPVGRYFVPGTDTPIEGTGLAPDLLAEEAADDLREGVDAVLQAALTAIADA